jgi:hypothetical protein
MSPYDLNSTPSPGGARLVIFGAILPWILICLPLSSSEFPIILTCALTAGITGMISALLWLFASKESADQFSNYAAAAFSGGMTIFGMGAISFPASTIPLLENIAYLWPWGAYIFDMAVVSLVAIDVWRRRRSGGEHTRSVDGVPTAPKTSSEGPADVAPNPGLSICRKGASTHLTVSDYSNASWRPALLERFIGPVVSEASIH